MIRRATLGDMHIVFGWRNSPEIIADSTLQRVVPWEEHEAWFRETVLETKRLLWIIEPFAGTVRVDLDTRPEGIISIYVLPAFQGRGLGLTSLRDASAEAFKHWPDLHEILAFIYTDNERSIRTFGAVGYEQVSDALCPSGHVAMVKYRE